jgi:hypothetical protein
MASLPMASSPRVLEPIDRISEVLFGLIMVLTFTGSLSVAEAGREDVKTMLVGALGCNLAWGLIDAIFYLMGCIAEHGRNLATFRAVKHARDERVARRIVADALPPIVASLLDEAELDGIRARLQRKPQPDGAGPLTHDDYLGALAVFLLVFLSTFPVALPFVLMADVRPAMRLSNTVAVISLFLTGYVFGRLSGHRAWLFGVGMVALGLVLVGLTIALGG